MQTLYHYTLGIKLASILSDGFIQTSPVKPKWPEKPIAWLSKNALYERSAIKMGMMPGQDARLLKIEEMDQNGKGLYRFVFRGEQDVKILSWALLRPKCKAKPQIIKRLVKRAALAKSSPADWYGTLDQNLPINRATLEKCTLLADGKMIWTEVEVDLDIAKSNNVLQCTVDQANQMGLQAKCTDQTWASAAN